MEPEDRTTDPQDLPEALTEARRRRRTLQESIVELEHAISSPASGRIPAWTAKVHEELEDVRDAFELHIEGTERPGGLYDDIRTRAPRLTHTIEVLQAEHPQIADAIDQMLDRLKTAEIGGPEWPLNDARDDLSRFIGKIVRHRQHGADLVWEAYNVDIGGPE